METTMDFKFRRIAARHAHRHGGVLLRYRNGVYRVLPSSEHNAVADLVRDGWAVLNRKPDAYRLRVVR